MVSRTSPTSGRRGAAGVGRESASHGARPRLTKRERDVLRTLESGASVGEIAARLQLSVGTVKTHLLHLYAKLGVRNRVQAAACARRLHDEEEDHANA